ncbi:GIGYF family protein Gyf-like [Vespa crabro]|uniref:GIGYF family protein Gyf-like n=1 Tax=Vespa crabro TaxID=7445 RepID=UPI001F01F477|nr:GIGYF family protein Gyf-like [Vespa crabro]
MTDSMKFGPEWLRNLSGENSNSSGTSGSTSTLSTPRYQLAEHRYGREEMLALFDRNYKPPEPLITFSTLYVEKTQLPLALIQMTEDETRMWNGGVTNIGGRGRGGSVDRGGRSRNGRGSLYSSHYSRAVGFEDSGEVIRIDSGQSFQGRSRPFDRSQSERGWSERNGSSDPIEWNGSTSPRKELSRGTSGSSLMESNWRRHRNGGEDDDGWRKWGRNSWREGGSIDRDRLDRNEGDGEESRSGTGGGRWEFRGSHRSHETNHIPPPRTARTWESNHHDNHDNLPEWATENPSESGGRFDASGAFHGGMYSDDDDEGIISVRNSQELRTRRVSEGNASITSKSINKSVPYGTGQGQVENRHHTNDSTATKHREKPKSVRLQEEKDNATERDVSNSPSKVVVSTSSNTSAKSLSSTSSSASLTMTHVNTNNTENDKTQPNDADNKCSNVIHDRGTVEPEVNKDIVVSTVNRQVSVQTESQKVTHDSVIDNVKKSEDDLDRMKEEADALVAKLMADEESHREKAATISPSINNQQTTSNVQEKWFYRDPQGEVQGPFLASEMAEWCKAGYFTAGLMVRRTCDERYTTLGELMKICGRVPFIPGPSIPPLKLSEPVIPSVPSTVPAGITATALPKSGIEDPLLLLQYQHMRLLQNQQILLRQMRTSAIAKLSQSEHWATLSPIEQNQLILQYVIQDSEIPDMPISTNPFVPHLTPSPSNPVMQLFSQMQQAKVQPEPHLPSSSQTNTAGHPGQIDPIQQLIQQMGGIQNVPTISQSNLNSASSQEDNPIKSLLRQLNVNATGHPQTSHIDTVWPHSPPQITPQFNAQNWLTQVGPIPAVPPGQLPTTLWNLHTKEIKTEQQILEEQNLKLQEQRKKEELRKQEELQRQAEEEKAKRKQEEEQVRQAEEAKRKEEERKKKEEDKKRKEEEKRKQEEEQKKKEEKKRKEEEKKKREEEKRKQEEENIKRKQEEEKRKREEIKKQEEKHKKEEEKKKKLEEEQRKQEEERIKKETEARKLLEAEEQARRTEQRRREAEALRKLQERSKAPWAQAPCTPAPTTHASLAEIQRLEREKKAEEQRYQQLMQQQLAQQKAVEAVQEAAVTDSSKRLQFKWAEKATSSNKVLQVKSLTQIQQEEQERIAKQQEKERHEKVVQKESANVLPNAGIWGTASQCLNWTNSSSSSNNQAWSTNSSTSGFWDDPTTMRSSLTTKQTTKPAATKSTSNQQPQQQNNKSTKNKVKKEEELVKKLFEQNTAKLDDFTQWCYKALSVIQTSVHIPTFVVFLRDLESPYEVKEYVRVYLGDSKQCTEFAKQFLEKRSKWRSAQRPQAQVDNLCKPAPAVNPNAPTEFQEVKGKSKKPKKGKMFKVDNRILGFSVTAAPDRINVGDRDYGEDV